MLSKQDQGFAHLLVILVVSGFGTLVVTSLIPVNRHYNDGKSDVAGVYLAKGGDDGGSSGSGGNSGSRDSGSSGSDSSPAKVEKVEVKQVEKEEKTRVEVKTTPEKFKSEVKQGDLRIKYEVENDKVKVETRVKKAEDEGELEDEAEMELEKEDVRIATAPGQTALVNKRVGALFNFPLSVDPVTKELTVTTPAGTKTVAVLPQQAVDNMLASGVMSSVVGERADSSLASIPSLVKLEIEDGVLGYKVTGVKVHRLFGLIPVKTEVEAFVSAENGQVVGTSESFLSKILNRVSL